MLIQFRFKNFRSFRDGAILDLSATRITEHSDRVAELKGERLLHAAAIYGANASGKSNVVAAFGFMRRYVLQSLSFGEENAELNSQGIQLTRQPFLFESVSKTAGSTFEVFFTTPEWEDHKIYNYGFTLDENGVSEEWLNCQEHANSKVKSILYRGEEGEMEFSDIDELQQNMLRISLNRKTLAVSLGAQTKIEPLKQVSDWFRTYSLVMDFSDVGTDRALSDIYPLGFEKDESVRNKVIEYFAAFDPSIVGFRVKRIGDNTKDFMPKLEIFAQHKSIDSNKFEYIPLEDESAGTQKMFALYVFLKGILRLGGTLFIDELNTRLHPLLIRSILLTFLNPKTNPYHAQIIFTTHDVAQLSNELLRRDEIWFVEKSSEGMSSLYSLADFSDEDGEKVRKDANYEKNYLLGNYGAIPVLSGFDLLGED